MTQAPAYIRLPSAPIQRIYKMIDRVQGAKIPFLITGDTGVGVEMGNHQVRTHGVTSLKPTKGAVMAKESRIHVTAHNLTDAEYKKLLAALESVADDIKITTDAPILTQTENEERFAKRQLEGTEGE